MHYAEADWESIDIAWNRIYRDGLLPFLRRRNGNVAVDEIQAFVSGYMLGAKMNSARILGTAAEVWRRADVNLRLHLWDLKTSGQVASEEFAITRRLVDMIGKIKNQ